MGQSKQKAKAPRARAAASHPKRSGPAGARAAPLTPHVKTVALPAATSVVRTAAAPSMVSVKRSFGELIISNREVIPTPVTIAGDGSFTVTGFLVNPLNSALFTWLPNVAAFDTFEVLSMSAEYNTMVSTGTNGMVVLAFDYDATDAAPGKTALENYELAVKCPIYTASAMTHLQRDRISSAGRQAFVGFPPVGAGLSAYYPAVLWVGTYGGNAALTTGEITVSYSIRFKSPQMVSAAVSGRSGYLTASGMSVSSSGGLWFDPLAISGTALGTTLAVDPGTAWYAGKGIRFLVPGKYLLGVFATSATASTATFSTLMATRSGTLTSSTFTMIKSSSVSGTGWVFYGIVNVVQPNDVLAVTMTNTLTYTAIDMHVAPTQ